MKKHWLQCSNQSLRWFEEKEISEKIHQHLNNEITI